MRRKATQWEPWVEIETTAGAQAKADVAQTAAINWARSFGLGGASKIISNQDLNTIVDTGFYYGQNMANAPGETTATMCLIVISINSGACIQKIFRHNSNVNTFVRRQTLGVWEPWIEMENTTGSQTKADQAKTEAINWAKGYGLGDVAKDITGTDLNNLDATGFYCGSHLGNSPGSETFWFYVINIKIGNTHSHQCAFRHTTNMSISPVMYIRRQGGTSWTPWVELETTSGAQGKSDQAKDAAINWVKSHGIGTITNGVSNLNTLMTSGLYNVSSSASGQPLSGNSGAVLVIQGGAGGCTQIWTLANTLTNDRIFVRHYTGSAWTEWSEMETTNGALSKIQTQPNWINAVLLNGWANVSGYPPASYMKEQTGTVHIRGYIQTPDSSPLHMFVLPVGLRPSQDRYVATMGFDRGVIAPQMLWVSSSGTVRLPTGFGGPVSIEYSFRI
ncbi:pyocin knob domain-containing protein [Sutcliffiella rhizosphaerae]|uniref:Uncharacterized protein n=1 Tax=Sutcliffiella rhizosphaerae TaxID=2880967 RepID=A0ABM8YMA3_9BACI|nr:pyocin knob domain-containing protein [Sutcliffiella rhizosphaerae]CAG9620883.1 hypothetical protein BACCIP111883_01654 [Sutcliffiella rhizosphaerae]